MGKREVALAKVEEMRPAEALAMALEVWHMAATAGLHASGYRMLVEGIKWADAIGSDGKAYQEQGKRFLLLASMFLEDYLPRLRQSGGAISTALVERLQQLTGVEVRA